MANVTLPYPDVSIKLGRSVNAPLAGYEENALSSIQDPEVRRAIAEAVQASKRVQGNLESFVGEFPIHGKRIRNEVIENVHIVERTIEGTKLVANTVTAEEIAADTITAVEIEAESITADKLNVTELSAITADLGTVEAGIVKGVLIEGVTLKASEVEGTTITGGTIRTAASGARVEMDSLGIRGINASAVEKFHFDTTTGILTATAVISSEDGSEIDGSHLNDETVTAKKLFVEKLGAISADLGEVTAGSLDAVTITGATIEGATIAALDAFHLTEESTEGVEGAMVEWRESATLREYIGGFKTPEQKLRTLSLGTQAKGATAKNASLMLVGTDEGSAKTAKAEFVVGGRGRVIIDAEENSEFLQLNTLANHKINFGSSTLSWSASSDSTKKEIAHGLGVTPSQVYVQLNAGTPCSTTTTKGGTNISVQGHLGSSFSGSIGFDWIAIA